VTTLGRVASPLFPFWHFDAKGGEVALLGLSPGFAWVGHKHSCFIIPLSLVLVYGHFVLNLCRLVVVELCGIVCVRLCATMCLGYYM
jgi:hypothetical protein